MRRNNFSYQESQPRQPGIQHSLYAPPQKQPHFRIPAAPRSSRDSSATAFHDRVLGTQQAEAQQHTWPLAHTLRGLKTSCKAPWIPNPMATAKSSQQSSHPERDAQPTANDNAARREWESPGGTKQRLDPSPTHTTPIDVYSPGAGLPALPLPGRLGRCLPASEAPCGGQGSGQQTA